MTLDLRRDPSTDQATLGKLFIDGQYFCETLEPHDGAMHPPIPLGTYRVIITYSVRFKRLLPLIVDVPGRVGIRIHPGNTEDDTEGCLLLGMGRLASAITHSRAACELFQSKIAQPLARQEPVTLTVMQPKPHAEALNA